MVLNGVGSMSFTGTTFLINRPETGALFSELDNSGVVSCARRDAAQDRPRDATTTCTSP